MCHYINIDRKKARKRNSYIPKSFWACLYLVHGLFSLSFLFEEASYIAYLLDMYLEQYPHTAVAKYILKYSRQIDKV